MQQANREHRSTIIQYIKTYSKIDNGGYEYYEMLQLTNKVTKKSIFIKYSKRPELLVIHGFSCNKYPVAKPDDCAQWEVNTEIYRKDVEGVTFNEIPKNATEEEQRRFRTAVYNLFDPEDTGLTKRAK
tara:strand:+ start:12928 stop:13311 length:384 start_codon:yes stop_codon:yes gene_type:complete